MIDLASAAVSLVAGVLGGAVGGGVGAWATLRAMRKTSEELESTEIRRQRVHCVTALMGLRFVMRPGTTDAQWSQCIAELNKVPALWSHDGEVLNLLRDFYSKLSEARGDPGYGNDTFVKLMRAMARGTSLPLDNLSDADITNIFRPRS